MDKQANKKRFGLVGQILCGLILGALIGQYANHALNSSDAAISAHTAKNLINVIGLLGDLFVSALKAVAPILIMVLVISAVARHNADKHADKPSTLRPILLLYVCGTFGAALIAVAGSFIFPSTLTLVSAEQVTIQAPEGIGSVLRNLLLNLVSNPIAALVNANYLGILSWAILLGLALRRASASTLALLTDISAAITAVVQWIIRMAPFGIFGLVTVTTATTGFGQMMEEYGRLIAVLLGCMAFVAFVFNPLLVFAMTRKNPYPLVFLCLRESGIPAFFTRSSAANIPVNMNLARKLQLDEETYSVSIPLGATINMAGAAITISVLSLAAAHTQGIQVDFLTALLLSLVATLGACGASGVAGGSLLLIPLACSLFNIPNEIAMQVVAVGYIIGVIQDSAETALNSSTDVLFTAAADKSQQVR